jgi:uncharacterized membrane protein
MIDDNTEKEVVSKSSSLFKKWLITGVLVSVPMILTFYIVLSVINFFDNLIVGTLFSNTIIAKIPGIGIIITVVSLVAVGFVASNFLGRFFISMGNNLVNRIPIIRTIYSTIQQIFDTLLSTKSKAFREVVLVEYPRVGMWSLAFVTSENKGEIQRKTTDDVVNIFIPTTPNPTSGFLLFVPRKDIIILDMKPDAAMKLIISGGVIDKEELAEEIEK